jgi:hypothetical protein
MEWLLVVAILLMCVVCTGGPFVLLRRVRKKRDRLRQFRIPLLEYVPLRRPLALEGSMRSSLHPFLP